MLQPSMQSVGALAIGSTAIATSGASPGSRERTPGVDEPRMSTLGWRSALIWSGFFGGGGTPVFQFQAARRPLGPSFFQIFKECK
jgi:hypothetical protein